MHTHLRTFMLMCIYYKLSYTYKNAHRLVECAYLHSWEKSRIVTFGIKHYMASYLTLYILVKIPKT